MRVACVAAGLLLAAGCADIDVRLIGPARPSLPSDCIVTLMPDVRLNGVVDVATANVSCARSRDRCLNELHKQACAVGGDVIFIRSERTEAMYIHMNATFGARAATP